MLSRSKWGHYDNDKCLYSAKARQSVIEYVYGCLLESYTAAITYCCVDNYGYYTLWRKCTYIGNLSEE